MSNIKLNLQQKKAIIHANGPLLIVAGAGTGKTTVITQRIKHLLTHQNIKPHEILALTFTEKSAEEMLNRVDEAMPLGYEEPWLSTFHSFCERILREEALEIGLDPSFKILSEPEQWLLIRKNIFDFDLEFYRPLGNPAKFVTALLTFFSHAKDEIITEDDFSEYTLKLSSQNTTSKDYEKEEIDKLKEISGAYKKYQELLLSTNSMDFGDLLVWTIRLFKTRPSILHKYQSQFKHILIDEFQDTNIAQFEIVKLLAPNNDNPNLVVVGDDDQAIFKFRGASISNILDFKKEYKNAKTIVLAQNYRSTQKILDASYQLIRFNNPDRLEIKLKINKKLQSLTKKDKAAFPLVVPVEDIEQESDFIVGEIKTLKKQERYKYSDFAILARANNHLDAFVTSLKRCGIPYSLVGNRGLFNQEEIKCLISLIRFLTNPKDNTSLYHLLISSIFSHKPEDISEILLICRTNKINLYDSLQERAKISKTLTKFFDLIKSLMNKIHFRLVTQILYEFLIESGYIKSLIANESVESSLKIKNINLFFEKVKNFESQTDNPTAYEFIDYLDLLIEAGENPAQAEIEDIDTVKLMTIHSAKGLEFPVVFIVNLTSDRFPSRERKEQLPIPETLIKETLPLDNYHLAEERRLFYVGATRAKNLLYLSWAKNYGGVREKKPSGFLQEIITEKHQTNSLPALNDRFLLSTRKNSTQISTTTGAKSLTLNHISFSQIETFNTCPLKYHYKYILGVTGIPNSALNFGQVLHRTLRDFHKFDLANKAKTKSQLFNLYRNHFAELAQGYQNQKHKEKTYKHGEWILENYYSKQKNLFGKPVFLERKFRIKVGNVYLVGAIDRIDVHQDKSYEIIDYKTGESKDKEKNIEKDEQLTIYALASKEVMGIKPKNLTLFFLEKQAKVSTTRSEIQIENQKEKILKDVQEIQKSVFPAKTGLWCKWCEYNQICPFYNPARHDF
jgi:DNA helicase-2/ATP-dependent DNA helicase PcrA